jgi:hypothetical protein
MNYLAFFRPAADRTDSVLPWVGSRGRSYGFLWAVSIIQIKVRKGDPTPAHSPVSDRRRLTALAEVHWARRVQSLMTQISGTSLQENQIIELYKNERCAVSTQEISARSEWGDKIFDRFTVSIDQLLSPSANRKPTRERQRTTNQSLKMLSFDSAEMGLLQRVFEILSRRRCQLQFGCHIDNSQ